MPRRRIDAQPAYILHSRPYRETSLILDAFTRDYGRVALVARGARRPHSALHGVLMAFQPLEIGWSGKGEVLTLMHAEWQGGQPLLSGLGLLCGYYLNELIMRLLAREDAHTRLFRHYAQTLLTLANAPEDQSAEATLRAFERILLSETGYGLTLEHDCQNCPIDAESRYFYEIERGAVPLPPASTENLPSPFSPFSLSGQTLLDIACDNYTNPETLLEAKQLMRRLLTHYLGGAELESRKLVMELKNV